MAAAYRDGRWTWGGRDGTNSISDAEQLLCLLYPATEVSSLALDRADSIGADVSRTLRPLGESGQLARALIGIIAEYVRTYTTEAGEPIFDSGGYVAGAADDPGQAAGQSAEQSALQIVDAYSMSVSLCLATLGFLQVYEPSAKRAELRRQIDFVRDAMKTRLTTAMVGLLRSFVVNTTAPEEAPGRAILSMINTTGAAETIVLERLRRQLARVRSRLRDDTRIGLTPDLKELLGDENLLFECGWTWGIADGAEPIPFVTDVKINTSQGYAESRPYLYFTNVALDGINDLLSPRTRELGLLDETQRRLADALQIRWDMTQLYWSTIARFGDQLWPLESIPWRTSDGEESDYYSLLVSAVLVQDLQERRATDDDLTRAVGVFEELARRGRITSRVTKGDKAIDMHLPGVLNELRGSAGLGGGPPLYRTASDFAPLLFKRSLQAASLSQNVQSRDRLMLVAESTMDHLVRRRLRVGRLATGLWDDPREALGLDDQQVDVNGKPSWYITERVIEGLVAAARAYDGPPLRSGEQMDRALLLLAEADHLLNRELMIADADDQSELRNGLKDIEDVLARARRLLRDRPGTAAALAMDGLARLDGLARADNDATRSM
jgi:hypothetical protein